MSNPIFATGTAIQSCGRKIANSSASGLYNGNLGGDEDTGRVVRTVDVGILFYFTAEERLSAVFLLLASLKDVLDPGPSGGSFFSVGIVVIN